MTEFWLLAALILLPGLLILAPPLLRPRIRVAADLNARNVQIARERLAELEAEHQAGNLNAEEFEQAKVELEGNMLDDLRQAEADGTDARPAHLTLMVLAVLVPLAAVVLYDRLGSGEIIGRLASVPAAGQQQEGEQQSMEQLLARLEQRLKEEPDNVEGWFILGRSYMAQQQYPEAVRAMEETYRLAPDNPNVMVSLADALAMNSSGKLMGRPEALLLKSLEIDPQSPTALWLLGMARQEQQDFAQAIGYWQKALPLLQDDAESVSRLNGMIDGARQMAEQAGIELAGVKLAAAEPTEAPAAVPLEGAVEIRLVVSLAPELSGQVAPDDLVFVMARAVSGPPMPLAAAKKRVADLPLTLSLTDAMAMMPQMKLSNFDQVVVQARVSKSGTPQAQSGDLQSTLQQTATRGKPSLELVIDSVVP